MTGEGSPQRAGPLEMHPGPEAQGVADRTNGLASPRTLVLGAAALVVVVGLFVAGFLIGGSRSPTTPSTTTSTAAPTSSTAPCSSGLGPCVAIDSPDATTVTEGVPFSFTVTARGTPLPRLRKRGRLPRGVAFRGGTGGTATLSGTATSTRRRPAVGVYHLVVVASTGRGAARAIATQSFTLTVVP